MSTISFNGFESPGVSVTEITEDIVLNQLRINEDAIAIYKMVRLAENQTTEPRRVYHLDISDEDAQKTLTRLKVRQDVDAGFYYAPYIPLLSQKYIRNEIMGVSDEEWVNSLDAVKYFRKKSGVEVTEDTISFT